jgi:hypothetical protein
MAIYSLFGNGNGSMQRVDVPENHAKNNLPIGTVLRFNGYGDHDYVIVGNRGIQPDYGASYDCVCIDDYREMVQQAYSLDHISEKKNNRIQVYYTDKVMGADEVLDLREKAKQAKVCREKAAQEKAEHQTAVKAGLPEKYPYLIQEKDSTKKGATLAAKNIRIELKRAFPKVKFSVRSEYYSGGNSVDVDWTDGPTTKQVDAIINKYQEGSFDGMTDCYNYEDNLFSDVFGGAKYVHGQRRNTEEAYNKTAVKLGYTEAKFNPNSGQFDGLPYDINEMIKRETWASEF